MSGNDKVVQVDHVSVAYRRVVAVDDVSLSVPAGSVYALLGRNGAGKSSLVRALVGQQKPDRGSVSLFGLDVWKNRVEVMKRVGVVPEDPDEPPFSNVEQTVAFCSKLYDSWNSAAVAERLRRFEVPMKTPFGRLSKGQKGQVSLALALGPNPDVLVLDDPTLGLDVVARRQFFEELIDELSDRGVTILITTHDLASVEGLADRVGILNEGSLVIDEEMESLKARFRHVRFDSDEKESSEALRGLDAANVRRIGSGTEADVMSFDDDRFIEISMQPSIRNAEVLPMSLEDIFVTVLGQKKGARV